jgi:hypothetical protein
MAVTNAVDRAARAMYANIAPDWDWDDRDAEPMRRMYRENARVVLATIREPGVPMDAQALAAWQATIDTMLAET